MRARTLWNNNGKAHLKKPFFQPLYICKQWIYLPLYAFTSRKNLLRNTYFLSRIRSMFPLLKSRMQIINLKSSNNQTIKHISYKTNNELIPPRTNLINSTLNISFSNILHSISTQTPKFSYCISFQWFIQAVYTLQTHKSQLGSAQNLKFMTKKGFKTQINFNSKL